jgi:nodulation protein F
MGTELAQDIISRLRVYAEGGPSREINLTTDIRSLGIQSLELTEVIFDLEEAYGIEVEMNTVDAWSQLKTVGDVVSKVGALVAAKG